MKKNVCCRGFTLIELLVVVAILAIIAGAVVALSNGLTTQSAATMTIATQKQLTNQITQFYQSHGRMMPDGFDSMIRDDFETAGASFGVTYSQTGPLELIDRGEDDQYGNSPPRGVIYTGYDADQDGFADAGAVSKGLTVMSWCGQGVHSLTVAKLTATDLSALNRMGITHVYDIAHDEDMVEGELTRVKRTLAVGDPIVIMDPDGLEASYDSFMDTSSVDWRNTATADKLTNRPHFVVFGLGPECTMIGDRRGGLQEAPACSTIVTWITAKPSGGNGYYNRYMVVIKIPADQSEEPTFAGVLDSNGWPVRAANIWYSRDIE